MNMKCNSEYKNDKFEKLLIIILPNYWIRFNETIEIPMRKVAQPCMLFNVIPRWTVDPIKTFVT